MAERIPIAIREKYLTKQPVGFCQFLASIGAITNVEACIAGQRTYLESIGALAKWYQGLVGYGRLVERGLVGAGAVPR